MKLVNLKSFPNRTGRLCVWMLTVVWPMAFAQTATNDYQAVVGPNNLMTSFKLVNDPHRIVADVDKNLYPLQVDSSTNTLQIRLRVDGVTNTKLKLFFPPGTRSIGGSFLLANRDGIPALGIMRMHLPPSTSLSEVTLDKAFSIDNAGGDGNEFGVKILTNLYAINKEVYFYGLAGGGGLPIAYGGYYLEPIPRTGGWVYGHFQYPSGRLATGNFGISVDKDCYINWYNSAKWDADGNPLETVGHSCSSSTPALPPALSLSANSLKLGESAVLGIANATDIGTCTSSVPSLLTIGQKSADKLSVSVTVPQSAGVTSDTPVTITCDSVPTLPQTVTVKKPSNTDGSSVPVGSVVQNNVSDVGFNSDDVDDKLKITYKNSIFGYPVGFNCQSNEYVDYSVGSVFPRIVLKSTVTLPSSLVLSTLTCSVGTGTLKSDFYISKSSDGVVRLHPSEPVSTLIKTVTTDASVLLKGVVPTAADMGVLTVWFGVELKSGEKYALVWNDAARKNEWRPGFPDLTPSSKVSYTPVQAKNNEFTFDLAGISQTAIDAYKTDGGTIKGTVYYQFGNGAVRQLHTVWVP